ncbi:MAG: hypothetical protein ACKVX7_16745 [Planctomycetota bacterium]
MSVCLRTRQPRVRRVARRAIGALSLLALTFGGGAAARAATVTLTLASPQAGTVVSPGATIAWTISAGVSSGDNFGLALVLVDLVQDPGNPSTMDLPPASGVPPAMELFSRPLGFSNPGPGGVGTGYVGLARGAPGALNLVQIGGAINTFGVAGAGIGLSTTVPVGVGQGAPVVIAEGVLFAPLTPGNYALQLQNATASTLHAVAAAPQHSDVRAAQVDLAAGSIAFLVTGAMLFRRGDCNGDAAFNIADAITVLTYLFSAPAITPPCFDACDAGDDGALDIADGVGILSALFSGAPPLPAPGFTCGADPSADALGCASSPAC